MNFWNKICGVALFFLFLSPVLCAQNFISAIPHSTNFLLNDKLNSPDSVIHFIPGKLFYLFEDDQPKIIGANYSTSNYGFFCREELKLEKTTRIPFRFRLGSLQQCDYYEGKKQ